MKEAPVEWSKIVDLIRKNHAARGGAVCFLRPQRASDAPRSQVMVDLSREGFARVPGREMGKKTLGRLLFRFRNTRLLRRSRAMIWTAYDAATNQSVVGFGASTTRKAAEKLKKLVPGIAVEDI